MSVLARNTQDSDANGKIDRIRIVTDGPLNDDFSGLTVTVAGYMPIGFDTGATPNDNEFFVLLKEIVAPRFGSPRAQTRPPWRWTMRCVMAMPTPVPS